MSLNLDKRNWTRVCLGEVAAASKEKVDPTDGTVDRYVAGEHMDTDDLQIHRWGDLGQFDIGPAFHRRFRPGQVLYGSRRTYLRKVAVAEFDGVCSNTTFVVDTKDPSVLDQRFLPFIMSADPFHAFAIRESKGSVNPYVNWSDIERYEFDLPPLNEQERLSDLLWATESHLQAVVARTRAVSHALRISRSRYVNSPLAPAVRASDAFEFSTGVRRTPDRASGDHMTPYLRSANVGYGRLLLDDVQRMNYSPAEIERFALRHGDVLVTEGSASASAVGMPARWLNELPSPVCFQMTLLRFRAIEGVCVPQFAYHWCLWAYESGGFLDVSGGTNIRHISALRSSQMTVRLPSLDEQLAVVNRLETMSKAEHAQSAEVDGLMSMRKPLLNDIFGDAE